jgi:tRNA(Arg) A34 adenosine deaminase TadA
VNAQDYDNYQPEVKSFWTGKILDVQKTSFVIGKTRNVLMNDYGFAKTIKRNGSGELFALLGPLEGVNGFPDRSSALSFIDESGLSGIVELCDDPLDIATGPCKDKEQWARWHSVWPFTYSPLIREDPSLIYDEIDYIHDCLAEALEQAALADQTGCISVGAVIAKAETKEIMATAYDPRPACFSNLSCCSDGTQGGTSNDASNVKVNPLKHAVVACIEKVGQLWTSTHPDELDVNAYLCTGLDLFVTNEPCVYCAMALVHSRISRVFFMKKNASNGALGSKYSIHTQKGLNHHYKAYFVEY